MLLSEVLPTIEVEKQPVYVSGRMFDKERLGLQQLQLLHLSLVELVGASHLTSLSSQVITHKTEKIICLLLPPRATVSITWDVSSLRMLTVKSSVSVLIYRELIFISLEKYGSWAKSTNMFGITFMKVP